MSRPVCALLLVAIGSLVGACNEIASDEDDNGRPLELAYLTQAIFQPSCGQTQCHSKFRQAGDLVFDNPDDAARSLLKPPPAGLIQFTADQYDPFARDVKPNLITWVTEIDPFAEGIGRMPFDASLPTRDIELLRLWIRSPFDESKRPRTGGLAHGAQCDPARYEGLACNNDELVRCGDDFNFTEEVVEACGTKGCRIGDVCDEIIPDPDRPGKTKCAIPTRVGAECSQ